MNRTRLASLLVMSLAFAGSAAGDDKLFPRPAALEPDVEFWLRIYTEVDTHGGLVHDSRHNVDAMLRRLSGSRCDAAVCTRWHLDRQVGEYNALTARRYGGVVGADQVISSGARRASCGHHCMC